MEPAFTRVNGSGYSESRNRLADVAMFVNRFSPLVGPRGFERDRFPTNAAKDNELRHWLSGAWHNAILLRTKFKRRMAKQLVASRQPEAPDDHKSGAVSNLRLIGEGAPPEFRGHSQGKNSRFGKIRPNPAPNILMLLLMLMLLLTQPL